MRTQILGLSAIFIVALALMPGQASSHREAPLVAQDPMADQISIRSIPTSYTRFTSTTTAMRSKTSRINGASRPRCEIRRPSSTTPAP